jgi:hypothetical protein
MRGLYNHLLSALLPLISAVIADQTATDMTNGQHGLLTLWCHTLSFGRWLGLGNSHIFDLVLLYLNQS